MGFCTTCGRQRSGPTRFCTGCGSQFSDPVDATPLVADSAGQQEPPAAQDWASPAASADAQGADIGGLGPAPTRADPWAAFSDQPAQAEPPPLNEDQTRWDTYYYKPGSAPAAQPPAPPPTETQLPRLGSAGQAGYGPPSYGQGPPAQGSYGQVPPHVPGTAGLHPLRRGQTIILITVVIVVLLAVGGGAYALVSHFTGHKSAASPPSRHPTVSAPAKTASSAASPGPTSAASASATASPARSSTSSPTASKSTSPKTGLTVSPTASANAAEPGVAAVVNKYFTSINTHDYNAYNNLLEPQLQASNTPSSFHTGYGTTTDLNEQLAGISDTSGGGEAAALTFTSHQSAAQSATGTACTKWTITLYLEPSGSSYLIGPAPSGYHAHDAAC